jgi:hypothetical protein
MQYIKPQYVTDTLQQAMQINFHRAGINATDISNLALRVGGAMDMFFGKINMNTIHLMGR